jgi:uncharacterized protein with PIN domain
VLCGDLNSRPGGVTHTYLSHGSINARRVAPWYQTSSSSTTTTFNGNNSSSNKVTSATTTTENETRISNANTKGVSNNTTIECRTTQESIIEQISDVYTSPVHDNNDIVEKEVINGMKTLNILETDTTLMSKKNDPTNLANDVVPQIRYLLDASLNKLCRWLRILGQDAALETDDEEKLRTGKGEMVIFQRCKDENRTLVTTSPRLMQRRDCPTSVYCIHPPYLSQLEVVLVHMLLTHGVELIPSTFLSRCVVCNGNIIEEHDDQMKRQILSEYEAPHELIDEGMAVYICDGCKQGYWWNDRPTSSASRVKTAASRLLELCVRGGVPILEKDDYIDHMFQDVKFNQLRTEGWDYNTPGSELLQQQLDVIEWLKQDCLKCPVALESAYLDKHDYDSSTFREVLPFTNITHHFVDTLDYIFFDKKLLCATERLYVPTSFEELSDGRTFENSHLLPSDVWPSDHLAIAARLTFVDHNNALPTINPGILSTNQEVETIGEIDMLKVETNMKGIFEGANKQSEITDNKTIQYCEFLITSSDSQPPPSQSILTVQPHGQRCLCGCVPPILSLFEMAEKRKNAKLNMVKDEM